MFSLPQAASFLKPREFVRWVSTNDLEQVKAIEPGAILCCLRTEA
jgi:hypothetical protein